MLLLTLFEEVLVYALPKMSLPSMSCGFGAIEQCMYGTMQWCQIGQPFPGSALVLRAFVVGSLRAVTFFSSLW